MEDIKMDTDKLIISVQIPKDFYTIKEDGIPDLDKAIKEIENGDVVSFESVDEAIKYLDDKN